MGLSEDALKALTEVLGEEYLSTDPAVMRAYSRNFTSALGVQPPAGVALPGKREDVQEIYRLANRFDFKVIPTGTHLFMSCEPTIPIYDYLIIDPKRMDRVWIDEENMYAVVEPYTTWARLQVEAMKRGLTCYLPTAGAQTSVVANLTFQGYHMSAHRLGAGARSMLAMEWVLPDGEIMNIGSNSSPGGEYFWGEGPGVDLRGMVKGVWGFFGGLGMCTKAGIKLFPWPGPDRLPTRGATPDKRVFLPEDKFKTYAIGFPTFDSVIDAMYEIGRSEIASVCVFLEKGWLAGEIALCQEDYFSMWESEAYQKSVENMLVVMLTAYTSKKQLEYEDEVLRTIMDEYGGKFLSDKVQEGIAQVVIPDLMIRPNVVFRGFRIAGSFFDVKGALDSIDHGAVALKTTLPFIKNFVKDKTPPFMDDEGATHYICSYDFGHSGFFEMPFLYEPDADYKNIKTLLAGLTAKGYLHDARNKTYPGGFVVSVGADIMGPFMGGFQKMIRDVKATFDPNYVSNPGWPVFMWSRLFKDGAKSAMNSYRDKRVNTKKELEKDV
jgi:hypothetical protein